MSPQRGQRGVTAGREEGEGLFSGNTERQGDCRGGQDSPGGCGLTHGMGPQAFINLGKLGWVVTLMLPRLFSSRHSGKK